MIDLNTKIEDIVKMDNKMVSFFNEEKIDYCCNGYKTIEEVAKEKGIEASELLDLVGKNIDPNNEDTDEKADDKIDEFKDLSLEEMISSVISDHHVKERDLLFEIDPLINKILQVHYKNHGQELTELHDLFAELKKELEVHFVKEEEVTFPLMLENKNPDLEIVKKVEDLEADHEKAGDLIKEMIELTNWFTVPEDGCNTYAYTFKLLDTLVRDIFVHIFKENSIMFEEYKKMEAVQ